MNSHVSVMANTQGAKTIAFLQKKAKYFAILLIMVAVLQFNDDDDDDCVHC